MTADDDGTLKEDEDSPLGGRKRSLGADDSGPVDEEDETFEEECMKQDIDEEQIDDMDDVQTKLSEFIYLIRVGLK